jgi:hypothetical protein
MACAMCDVYVTDCAHTPLISGTETIPKLGFKHVMSLGFDISCAIIQLPINPFESEDLQGIVVPDRFRHVFYNINVTEFACMAANDS